MSSAPMPRGAAAPPLFRSVPLYVGNHDKGQAALRYEGARWCLEYARECFELAAKAAPKNRPRYLEYACGALVSATKLRASGRAWRSGKEPS